MIDMRLHYQAFFDSILQSQTMNRPPHAFLFYGTSYASSKKLALFLCEQLLELAPQSKEAQWVQNQSHPQVLILESDGLIIPIESVRQAIENFQMRANGQKSLFIINGVDKLKTESINALLKTLEEPPKNSLIFCLSEKKDALLPTLLSRLVPMSIPPLSKDKIPQDKQLLWSWCQGSLDCMLKEDTTESAVFTQVQVDLQIIQDPNKRASFVKKNLMELYETENLLQKLDYLMRLFFIASQTHGFQASLQKMTEAFQTAILEKNTNVSTKILLRSLELRLSHIINTAL